MASQDPGRSDRPARNFELHSSRSVPNQHRLSRSRVTNELGSSYEHELEIENAGLRDMLTQAGIDAARLLAQAGVDAVESHTAKKLQSSF